MNDPVIPARLHVRAESLFIYPIKSCAGVRVPSIQLDALGAIEGDRQWAVADTKGELVWQGSHPRLTLVQPSLRGSALVLSAPGMQPLEVPTSVDRVPCEVRIWNEALRTHDVFEALDAGPEARDWFRQVTGADLRLLRLDSSAVTRESANPVHILSARSLKALNQALSQAGHAPVEVERFRPNIVLADEEEQLTPFLEEHMLRLHWPAAASPITMRVTGLCIRCVVPNVDLFSATVAKEPLKTVVKLSALRHPGQPPYFGVYACALNGGRLSEGAVGEAELNC